MQHPIPFHLAFPVTNVDATIAYYRDVIGCGLGRRAERWADFDFFGHQISAHLVDDPGAVASNPVDGQAVPVRHFGAILPWDDWHALRDRLISQHTRFIIEPQIRFAGKPGEQATMFFSDPSGNALEFKSFRDPEQIFNPDGNY